MKECILFSDLCDIWEKRQSRTLRQQENKTPVAAD